MTEHQIQTEIEIDAGPECVWAILADFANYPEWNPFIPFIRGALDRGERLEVRIQPGGTKGMSFRPVILVADAGRELRWLGRLLLPGLFDGEHRFAIEPLAEGKVLFRQSERFRGLLVGLFCQTIDRDTARGFEAMNLALKARAEAMHAAARPAVPSRQRHAGA